MWTAFSRFSPPCWPRSAGRDLAHRQNEDCRGEPRYAWLVPNGMRIGSSHTPEPPPAEGALAPARSVRRPRNFVLCALLLGACQCDPEQLTLTVEPGTCEPDFACPVGTAYRRGACVADRCQSDLDCCPGQRCNAAVGFCGDQYRACTDDADCADRLGQACITFRGGTFCGYPNRDRVLSDAETQGCTGSEDCDPDRVLPGRAMRDVRPVPRRLPRRSGLRSRLRHVL